MSIKTAGFSSETPGGSGERSEQQARITASRRTTTTRELLAGGNELQIEHNGEIYTLRKTSKGKLILTK